MESYNFSTGGDAKKDSENWDKKVLEENNKKQSDIEKARQVKFDNIKIGDTAQYRGETYSVSEKHPDNLTINISSHNEENRSFTYGLTVSVDDVSDYYTPDKNIK